MSQRKVLLIGWDAADWEHITLLLEEGLMPTLEAFINRGVMGNLATLQPILSPLLWNSVATGKFADKHGIHGFIEPDPVNGGVRPYTSTSRKTKALWNILTQSGLHSNVVGWWASHPAEPIKGNAFGGVRFDPEAVRRFGASQVAKYFFTKKLDIQSQTSFAPCCGAVATQHENPGVSLYPRHMAVRSR